MEMKISDWKLGYETERVERKVLSLILKVLRFGGNSIFRGT